MSTTFWTNTIWYVLLAISTLIELIFAMVKAKRRGLTFAFYLVITGVVLFIETGMLIFLKSYTYYPKIIHNVPYQLFQDSLAGNLFSQLSLAATALLIAVFNLRWYWYFIFAVIYGLIEEVFLALGIYTHNWYQTWMTVTFLPLYFWWAKKLYEKIAGGLKPIFHYACIFLALAPIAGPAFSWPLWVSGYITYSTSVLSDPTSSMFFLSLAILIPPSIIMMLVYYFNPNWIWKALTILLLYTICYIAYRYNLIMSKKGTVLQFTTLVFILQYVSIFILDRLLGGPKRKLRGPNRQ